MSAPGDGGLRPTTKSDVFVRPLSGPLWLRPVNFLARMVRLHPRLAGATTVVVAMLSLTEGLGLGLLLPLLSLIGVATGSDPTSPARIVVQALGAVGIPAALIPVLAVFVLVGLLQIGLHAVHQRLILRAAESARLVLRRRLFEAISRAQWTALAADRSGHLINAAVSEALRIGVVYGNAMTGLGLLLNLLVYMLLATWISWRFTATAAVIGCLSMFGLRWIYRASRRVGGYTTGASNKMQEVLNEHVGAAKLIRGMGAGDWSRRVFDAASSAVSYFTLRNQTNSILIKVSVEPFGLLLLVIMIYVSLEVIGMPPAELILLLLIAYRMIPRIVILQEMLQRIVGVLPAYEEMVKTITRLDAAREKGGTAPFTGLRRAIELRGVVVHHAGRSVLSGVDLAIPARATVSLIGPSGGGKTTLLDVLAGLLPVENGEVLVDGVALHSLDLDSYRRRIGIVPQETIFFHDSIEANLRVAAPDATGDEMWRALAAAHADEFVRADPQRLNRVLGDTGLRLSGGQRQRLSLARALLRKPEILLLDEPSSALDVDSEEAIRLTLAGLRGQVTIVVVSHRASLVHGADLVYRIEDGRATRQPTAAAQAAG